MKSCIKSPPSCWKEHSTLIISPIPQQGNGQISGKHILLFIKNFLQKRDGSESALQNGLQSGKAWYIRYWQATISLNQGVQGSSPWRCTRSSSEEHEGTAFEDLRAVGTFFFCTFGVDAGKGLDIQSGLYRQLSR